MLQISLASFQPKSIKIGIWPTKLLQKLRRCSFFGWFLCVILGTSGQIFWIMWFLCSTMWYWATIDSFEVFGHFYLEIFLAFFCIIWEANFCVCTCTADRWTDRH